MSLKTKDIPSQLISSALLYKAVTAYMLYGGI